MSNQTPHFYNVAVKWSQERKGTMTSEGLPTLEVATPPEFEGHAGIWTPEHLYVAAINSCFMATFLSIASFSKLEFASFQSNATGKLEKVESVGLQITEVAIVSKLVINNKMTKKKQSIFWRKLKNIV